MTSSPLPREIVASYEPTSHEAVDVLHEIVRTKKTLLKQACTQRANDRSRLALRVQRLKHRLREESVQKLEQQRVQQAKFAETSLKNTQELLQRKLEKETKLLALQIAEHIIGESVQMDSTRLQKLIEQALNRLRHEPALTIEVHPSDHEAVSTSFPDSRLSVLSNDSLALGTARIIGRTGTTTIDWRRQLRSVATHLVPERTSP